MPWATDLSERHRSGQSKWAGPSLAQPFVYAHIEKTGGTNLRDLLARHAFGEDQVIHPGPTYLGSEDFAFMLQKQKGTYCFLGNGDTKMVHHPEFVFNQDILPIGAAYWVALAEGHLR